jgi:integrase
LRHLSREHLDDSGLHLDAAWTKNRKSGFLPLPKSLIEKLQDFDEARDYYKKVYATIPAFIPERPLLYVPRDPARELDKDLRAANIPKETAEGKLDFHALRVTYINMVIDSGATVKEAQVLARHTTPELTMNVYGRAKQKRLTKAVEDIAQRVLYVSERMDGTENQEDIISNFNGLEEAMSTAPGGSNPPFGIPFSSDISIVCV